MEKMSFMWKKLTGAVFLIEKKIQICYNKFNKIKSSWGSF